MISQSEIKLIRKLHTNKGRKLHSLVMIEGKRLFSQLEHYNVEFEKIWTTQEFEINNKYFLNKIRSREKCKLISNIELKKICLTKNPSGIIGITKIPRVITKKNTNQIIVLDDIADPGNLGTILRTACWFGIKNILLSKDCVDPYNPKVIRSAMGAHFNMNIISGQIEDQLQELKKDKFQIIAADVNARKSIKDFKLSKGKWALVMGSESKGLSKNVSKLVDEKIEIINNDEIESLNVSVACGIFLYHFSN